MCKEWERDESLSIKEYGDEAAGRESLLRGTWDLGYD